jgi:hypothetical protein
MQVFQLKVRISSIVANSHGHLLMLACAPMEASKVKTSDSAEEQAHLVI